MADRIAAQVAEAILRARAGEIDRRVIVDLTFDAFGKEGAGALASWMILSGDHAALEPIMAAAHRLVDELGPLANEPMAAITLSLVLSALGDALLGEPMARALGLPRETARVMAFERLLGARPG
jgi:hypothetical protein